MTLGEDAGSSDERLTHLDDAVRPPVAVEELHDLAETLAVEATLSPLARESRPRLCVRDPPSRDRCRAVELAHDG